MGALAQPPPPPPPFLSNNKGDTRGAMVADQILLFHFARSVQTAVAKQIQEWCDHTYYDCHDNFILVNLCACVGKACVVILLTCWMHVQYSGV